MKGMCWKYLLLAVFPVFMLTVVFSMKSLKAEAFTIVLDPGHGGEQPGAQRESKKGTIDEKDLNLKIAEYLKEALEQYKDVDVIMTREDDKKLDLSVRSNIAVSNDADLLVSLHNNAAGPICAYDHGCTVLVSKAQYKEEIGLMEQDLGACILYELEQLGIENQGLLLRTSQNGTNYPNGELADYYGIVKRGVQSEIPAIIVEHAFIDSDTDYEEFLSTDEKLASLAEADAKGLARYYGLEKTDSKEKLEPLKNRKEKLVWVKDENPEHNEISYKTFFEEKKDKNQ